MGHAGGKETSCELFHILNFEQLESLPIQFFFLKNGGMNRYDLSYILIKVTLKWFRYACVIFFF